MKENNFSNLTNAYHAILSNLHLTGHISESTSDPNSIGSHFGAENRRIKEIIGYSFTLDNPTNRIISLSSRSIDLPFAIANCIWTVSGLDSLEFISFYNRRGLQFSDDKATLHGAHGKRLFNFDGLNQVLYVIEKLKKDKYSRRAVATIYHPTDISVISNDIPCPIALQFLQRNKKLHAITFMRSQSAAMVLPYDAFVFTFLQEMIAVELGLDLGSYHHISGSFHYYLDEEPFIKRILAEEIPVSETQMPPMPKDVSPFKMTNKILELERMMRSGIQLNEDEVKFHLPFSYWRDLFFILASRIMTNTGKDATFFLSCLPNYYAKHLIGKQK